MGENGTLFFVKIDNGEKTNRLHHYESDKTTMTKEKLKECAH
jgi:hypothetical protein